MLGSSWCLTIYISFFFLECTPGWIDLLCGLKAIAYYARRLLNFRCRFWLKGMRLCMFFLLYSNLFEYFIKHFWNVLMKKHFDEKSFWWRKSFEFKVWISNSIWVAKKDEEKHIWVRKSSSWFRRGITRLLLKLSKRTLVLGIILSINVNEPKEIATNCLVQ